MSENDGKKHADTFDQRVRRYAVTLPLAERQKLAESFGHIDGIPLTENDVRRFISRARDAGISRQEARDALIVDDPAQRRIGSLNPAEIDKLLAGEWPVTS